MEPPLLFDKSVLQSLSLDESVWFDKFFMTVITPIFYVETLADLAKVIKSGRTSEDEVRIIAKKTPNMNAQPNIFHLDICMAELLGNNVPLDGRIIIAGGKPIKSEGKKGFIYNVAPEVEAFYRWQDGNFSELERNFAKTWRLLIKGLNLNEVKVLLKNINVIPKRCNSFEEAKSLALSIINDIKDPFKLIELVFTLLGLNRKNKDLGLCKYFCVNGNSWLLNITPLKLSPLRGIVNKRTRFMSLIFLQIL
ncbi:hypothetical protein ACFL4T_14570 [candidate division KSB1 bacterium]